MNAAPVTALVSFTVGAVLTPYLSLASSVLCITKPMPTASASVPTAVTISLLARILPFPFHKVVRSINYLKRAGV